MSYYRACAYSYLNEESSLCDYEIATDELASQIGLASHYVKHSDLSKLIELVYHANGSMRGKMAISNEDFAYINKLYEDYSSKAPQVKYFVLPAGCLGASYLHVLRAKTKGIIRLMVKIEREENIQRNQMLYDFFNILSNVFFYMALYENANENVEEVEFKSKSYEC